MIVDEKLFFKKIFNSINKQLSKYESIVK